MDKQWNYYFKNPPKDWRNIWSKRNKIERFDNQQKANNFISKNGHKYKEKLQVDIHPKDGYVVYYN